MCAPFCGSDSVDVVWCGVVVPGPACPSPAPPVLAAQRIGTIKGEIDELEVTLAKEREVRRNKEEYEILAASINSLSEGCVCPAVRLGVTWACLCGRAVVLTAAPPLVVVCGTLGGRGGPGVAWRAGWAGRRFVGRSL
jgi:hypothetical protein